MLALPLQNTNWGLVRATVIPTPHQSSWVVMSGGMEGLSLAKASALLIPFLLPFLRAEEKRTALIPVRSHKGA